MQSELDYMEREVRRRRSEALALCAAWDEAAEEHNAALAAWFDFFHANGRGEKEERLWEAHLSTGARQTQAWQEYLNAYRHLDAARKRCENFRRGIQV